MITLYITKEVFLNKWWTWILGVPNGRAAMFEFPCFFLVSSSLAVTAYLHPKGVCGSSDGPRRACGKVSKVTTEVVADCRGHGRVKGEMCGGHNYGEGRDRRWKGIRVNSKQWKAKINKVIIINETKVVFKETVVIGLQTMLKHLGFVTFISKAVWTLKTAFVTFISKVVWAWPLLTLYKV